MTTASEDKQLLVFVRRIIATVPMLQHETDVFDLEGERLIWQFRHGKGPAAIESGTAHPDPFEFDGGGVAEVLKFVLLLWGTFKMVEEVKQRVQGSKEARPETRSYVAHSWVDRLVGAGLAREIAETIVAEHGDDAAEFVLAHYSQ